MLIYLYSITALVMFIWSAVLPALRAQEQRSSLKLHEELRSIQLKYSRKAYGELAGLSASEIEARYGLKRAYRSIRRIH